MTRGQGSHALNRPTPKQLALLEFRGVYDDDDEAPEALAVAPASDLARDKGRER